MTLRAALIVLAGGCLAGWLGRYFVIEPDALRQACAGLPAPGWCAARTAVIDVTFRGLFAPASIGAAAAGWLLRGRAAGVCISLALLAGGLGLYLYDTGWSATGVLAALLAVPRTSGAAARGT